MIFSILTLFPEQIEQFLSYSILGRAIKNKAFQLENIQIRDFAINAYGQVDDALFGGGRGMLMQCEPIYRAWKWARKEDQKSRTIFLSPKGSVLNQAKVQKLATYDQIILLCGHYEGIDQRVLDEIVDEEISIGDFVLTGGEVAACTLVDAVARNLPHVLPDQEAFMEESFFAGTLEFPQYTRPAVWRDRKVPEILLSGHHLKIQRWRYLMSLYETWRKRPDLFEKLSLSQIDWEELLALKLEWEQNSV